MKRELDHFRAGDGEPLILLHGADESWHSWRPVLDTLSGQFAVHALTFPGHLGSPDLGEPVSIAAFADAVEAYLDRQGLERAHIAGISLGGMVTLELLRRGRARSAVDFSGPIAFSDERKPQRLLRMLYLNNSMFVIPGVVALCSRSPRVRRWVLTLAMAHGERMSTDEFEKLMAAGGHANVAAPYVKSVIAGNRAAPLEAADVPVCVAWGDKDRLVPVRGYGAPTHRHVRGARLVVLEDSGHIPTWDNPEGVVEVIRETTARAGVR